MRAHFDDFLKQGFISSPAFHEICFKYTMFRELALILSLTFMGFILLD